MKMKKKKMKKKRKKKEERKRCKNKTYGTSKSPLLHHRSIFPALPSFTSHFVFIALRYASLKIFFSIFLVFKPGCTYS